MTTDGRLAILDRDGVINHDSDAFIRNAAQWVPIDGSIAAIARLSRAGFCVCVATNQSGIGRGLFGRDALYAMNRKLRRLVRAAGGEVDTVAFCPHRPDAGCECRKPGPGLLDAIAQRTGKPLRGALLVGDSLRDLEAGSSRGCELWLVRTGKGERSLAATAGQAPSWWQYVSVADDLAAVVERTLGGAAA